MKSILVGHEILFTRKQHILNLFSDTCMVYDLQRCSTTCENSGLKMTELSADGEVCPFQFFCKCSSQDSHLQECSELCVRKGGIAVNSSRNEQDGGNCLCSSQNVMTGTTAQTGLFLSF